jgi:hypothetical protein
MQIIQANRKRERLVGTNTPLKENKIYERREVRLLQRIAETSNVYCAITRSQRLN